MRDQSQLCPCVCYYIKHLIQELDQIVKMPLTKRTTTNQLSDITLSEGVDDLKLQFPPLPQEWKDRYIPGQMFKYQASLPKLPVPPLHQTLHKYIASVEPLVSKIELERTKALIAEFGRPGGVGEMLQKLLEKRAEEKDNWLFDWWNQVMYHRVRRPIVFHSNPGMWFPIMQAKDTHELIRLMAKMTLAVVKWNLLFQHEAVPPDVYRKKPMCMSQYSIFSKCRIPYPEEDKIRYTPISESKHVIVMKNGHIFRLDILYECPDGTLAVAPSSHIIEQLYCIFKMSSDPCEYPLGILTAEHRDIWSKSRMKLIVDPTNKRSLDVIERAQFIVCLDQSHPNTSQLQFTGYDGIQDYQKSILANRVLHGNGSKQNSSNRWFDTAVQLFVGEDGFIGLLLEHSAADGPSATVGAMFILNLMKVGYDILGESSPVPSKVLCPAEKLQWKLSTEITNDILTAKKNLDDLVEDVDLQLMTFNDFGKEVLKMFKLSPDGFIQMAIQLAYYKLYGHPTATHESGNTRWFHRGRTDTIRSCTNAAHTFIQTMADPTAAVEEKAKALLAAIKAHFDYTVDVVSGQGIDRHLLGLRLIAQEAGMEIPDFFKDEVYSRSSHYCLFTSQVALAEHEIFLFFGAKVPNGYGICYNPQNNKVTFAVSSLRSCPETDSQVFGAKLMESMREMQAMLVKASCRLIST